MIGVVWDQPGQLQDVQQLLLVFPVLLGSARVQLEGWLLEERQNFSQRSQLYQVQEVKVAEPLGPFAGRQLRVKTLSELRHIVTPLLLKPAVWRKEGNKSECQLGTIMTKQLILTLQTKWKRKWTRAVFFCLTIQQISGTQVYVNAGVETWDKPEKSPFLHTLAWERKAENLSKTRQKENLKVKHQLTFQPAVERPRCKQSTCHQIQRKKTKLRTF